MAILEVASNPSILECETEFMFENSVSLCSGKKLLSCVFLFLFFDDVDIRQESTHHFCRCQWGGHFLTHQISRA